MRQEQCASTTMQPGKGEVPANSGQYSDDPRCSRYTIAAGEDPIGTASDHRRYLLVEVPTPWRSDVWHSKHVPPVSPRSTNEFATVVWTLSSWQSRLSATTRAQAIPASWIFGALRVPSRDFSATNSSYHTIRLAI
jgi:hypothetical protein